MVLKIHKELESLIPPLTKREYEELEKSILQEGCREDIVVWKDIIIDGHNRYNICRKHGIEFKTLIKDFKDLNDAKIWMITNQFARRNMDEVAKALLALKLKDIFITQAKEKERLRKSTFHKREKSNLEKINTNKKIAEIADISHNTINKVVHILNSEEEDLKKLILNREISIDKAEKERKERLREKERKKVSQKGSRFEIGRDIKLGDFRKVLNNIPNGSVKAIITDPPYHRVSLDCYSQLAEFAKEKLSENGFLACYAGQLYLPEVIKRLGEHLDYYWTIAMIHQGHTTLLKPLNVVCEWKPILIFQKGKRKSPKVFTDSLSNGAREKGYHPWGQALQESISLIEYFTDRGDLVVDPFLGGGTCAVAALSIGRNFIGAEIDENNYNIVKARLIELRKKKIRKILEYVNRNPLTF